MESQIPKVSQYKILGRYYRYIEPVVRDPLIRGYFEIVATILLVAFFVMFAIRPTLKTIAGLLRTIDDLKQVEQALDAKINSLVQAQANYSRIKPKLPLLDKALPPKPEVDNLVIDLERRMQENQVEIAGLSVEGTGLTPDAWKLNPNFVEKSKVPLGFSLTTKSGFPKAELLLSSLANDDRLMSIQRVSFSSSGESKELSIGYSGSAFFLP